MKAVKLLDVSFRNATPAQRFQVVRSLMKAMMNMADYQELFWQAALSASLIGPRLPDPAKI